MMRSEISQTRVLYDIAYTWNLNRNRFTDTENKLVVTGEETKVGRDKLEIRG